MPSSGDKIVFAKIQGAHIAAIHTAVPQQEIRIEDELEYYGGSLKKVFLLLFLQKKKRPLSSSSF